MISGHKHGEAESKDVGVLMVREFGLDREDYWNGRDAFCKGPIRNARTSRRFSKSSSRAMLSRSAEFSADPSEPLGVRSRNEFLRRRTDVTTPRTSPNRQCRARASFPLGKDNDWLTIKPEITSRWPRKLLGGRSTDPRPPVARLRAARHDPFREGRTG